MGEFDEALNLACRKMDKEWESSGRPRNKSLQSDKFYSRTEHSRIKELNNPAGDFEEEKSESSGCNHTSRLRTRVTFSKPNPELSVPEMFSVENMIDHDSLPECLHNPNPMPLPMPDEDLEISGRFWPKPGVELVPPDKSATEIETPMGPRASSPDLHFYMDPLPIQLMAVDNIYDSQHGFKNKPDSRQVHCSPHELNIPSTTDTMSIVSRTNGSCDDTELHMDYIDRPDWCRERPEQLQIHNVSRSELELYLKKRQNDIKTIKRVYYERGLFPIPETNDINYLTMEMKRRLYCLKYGLNHGELAGVTDEKEWDSRQCRSASALSLVCQRLSGCEYIREEEMNQTTVNRHFVPLLYLEGEDLPRKVRLLNLGTQNSTS